MLAERPDRLACTPMIVYAIYLHNHGQFLDEPTKALPLDAGFDDARAKSVGCEMLRVSDREIRTIQLEGADGIAERIVAVFNRAGEPITY